MDSRSIPAVLHDLVVSNRSYRRFHQDEQISRETLLELVELGRLSASAMNMQPLQYRLVNDPATCAAVFPNIGWALHLKEWPGPEEGERPAAYIFIVGDTRLGKNNWYDHGIAAQSILLGAVARGLGGCMLGSIKREGLRRAVNLPEHFEILLLLALGRPKERIVIDDLLPGESFKYWREPDGTHHVPKRRLADIIVE